ncbi:hypothetical protein WJX72_001241 [[Myrmecia] bisecta]|uniref:Myb-like domain-containing protein n=1 Tax=[Myrmecia] bisecta TaxID=41462 RepID=A0AAW1R576_9CHLO
MEELPVVPPDCKRKRSLSARAAEAAEAKQLAKSQRTQPAGTKHAGSAAGGQRKRKAPEPGAPQDDAPQDLADAAAPSEGKRGAQCRRLMLEQSELIGALQEEEIATANEAHAKKGKGRQRVLVDMHGNSTAAAEAAEPENEYERMRQARIERNTAMLKQLGVQRMAQQMQATAQQAGGAVSSPQDQEAQEQRRKEKAEARRQRAAEAAAQMTATRRSHRLGGEGAGTGDAAASDQAISTSNADPERAELLELEEFFKWKGQEVEGFQVDGHYHGWVNPAICEKYALAANSEQAWEQNGGGKFTFKIDKSAIPASLKSKGWSDARAFSATQLQKNPNTYFYRHVAPHEVQAQGEWTQEEHDLFLTTAKANGVGDKWGLFASYIPQRVGYQCSAYYREVVIPRGLIFDPRFRMTRGGKAVFVG